MATRRRRTTKPVEPPSEQVLDENASIEALMSAALADTFEAIQKAEEEKEVDGFFDPSFYVKPVPIQSQPPEAAPLLKNRQPRYLERQTRQPRRRTR